MAWMSLTVRRSFPDVEDALKSMSPFEGARKTAELPGLLDELRRAYEDGDVAIARLGKPEVPQ